ncbi:Uncharacterized protein TPAR_03502, partial [Tolypocladium paradoxum]
SRRRRRDAHRLGPRIEPRRGADDELDAAGRVLREPRRDGLQQRLVLDGARDDGAHGGNVPVEVAVLQQHDDDPEVWLVRERVLEQPVGDGQAAQRAPEYDDCLWHVTDGPPRWRDVSSVPRVYDDGLGAQGCLAALFSSTADVSVAMHSVLKQTPLSLAISRRKGARASVVEVPRPGAGSCGAALGPQESPLF